MKNTKQNNLTHCSKPLLSVLVFIALSALSKQAFSSDMFSGKTTYELHCIMCHGKDSKNPTPGAANFSKGEGLFQSDTSLLERIKKGKNACPSYKGILRNQQIFDVISYLRALY